MVYEQVLQEVAQRSTVTPGSLVEAEAISRFRNFVSDMSPARARA